MKEEKDHEVSKLKKNKSGDHELKKELINIKGQFDKTLSDIRDKEIENIQLKLERDY